MRRFLKNNGLSLVMGALFLVFWVGQSFAGLARHNEEQAEHGKPRLTWGAYVVSGDFLESTFENWESEFLQMAAFLILSSMLVQRGAAESKDPDPTPREQEEKERVRPDSPGPVHRGGWALALYSRSLSLSLSALFVFSFAMHAVTGQRKHDGDLEAHGKPAVGLAGYVLSSDFWFESLQNWQSEFMSIGVLVVLSIWLRQKGSPESKPVAAPHAQTGT